MICQLIFFVFYLFKYISESNFYGCYNLTTYPYNEFWFPTNKFIMKLVAYQKDIQRFESNLNILPNLKILDLNEISARLNLTHEKLKIIRLSGLNKNHISHFELTKLKTK